MERLADPGAHSCAPADEKDEKDDKEEKDEKDGKIEG
jgi:hypothetical protein